MVKAIEIVDLHMQEYIPGTQIRLATAVRSPSARIGSLFWWPCFCSGGTDRFLGLTCTLQINSNAGS